MRVIELTIKFDYVDWGVSEGIREILQNAIDAEFKRACKAVVKYDEQTQCLKVSNEGVKLPAKVLLLGYSTKKDDAEQVGQFGEGLKLGCLALVKAGLSVVILNGNEVWTPLIKESRDFPGEQVLAFQVEPSSEDATDLSVVISGVEKGVWEAEKLKYMRFSEVQPDRSIETPFGYVLDDVAFRGGIYTHGILVEKIKDEEFVFGYDLNPGYLNVDRDRRLVHRSELKNQLAKVWNFLGPKDNHIEDIETMLIHQKADISNFQYSWQVDKDIKDLLYERFLEKYGKDAYAIDGKTNDYDIVILAGKVPIIVDHFYLSILKDRQINLSELEDQIKNKVSEVVAVEDLTHMKLVNLFKAKSVLSRASLSKLPNVEVCHFRSKSILGLYRRDSDGVETIFLSNNILDDICLTLETLVHEYAHQFGGHFDSEFLNTIEKTWSKIYALELEVQ